ncbi:MAG: hypothetical protein ACI3ZC_10850 [Candidatus Cryptobacteroides sp.]
MNTRLEQFLSAENLSQSQFADTIKVARASVSHILAGRNKPGWDFLTSMMKHFPDLNLEWLMTGNGKMYKSASMKPVTPEKTDKAEEYPGLFSSVSPSPARMQSQDEHQVPDRSYSFQKLTETENSRQEAEFSREKRQDLPQSPIQVIDNQRKIAKIMVFYDDNTFIEIK